MAKKESETEIQLCGNCAYCLEIPPKKDQDPEFGECRRHAPMPAMVGNAGPDSRLISWPVVRLLARCGEWRAAYRGNR
jgi:hypothetical protein